MRTDDLAPGEMRLSPVVIDGHRRYAMKKPNGQVETGSLVSPDHPCAAHAEGVVDLSEPVRPGVRRVTSNIDYTAPGSRSRASTSAYRSGWDATFGRKGDDGCGPKRAN